MLILWALPLAAQTPEPAVQLRLSRDFGYGGFGGDIEGVFSFRVKGPDNLSKVEYYIDDRKIGESTEPPWRLQFNTNDYPLGVHDLYVIAETADGQTLKSNVITREFVPKSTSTGFIVRFVVPIIILAVTIPALIYLIDLRRGRGKSRGYGPFGGAVCPKCGKPFARHIWGLNLGAGKFDRCPHCGKWSLVRRASPEDLAAAEALLAEPDQGITATAEHPPDKLRKQLDESRYEDL